ncbi:MAG: sodium:solute symporter family protein [bacterium]
MLERLFEHLTYLDWAIILGYFVFAVALGMYHSRKATSSIDEYFASGRSAPWWILGTSMVATTFAADTPLAVSALVVTSGIAGNWYWWCLAMGSVLAVFFHARLWRRTEVLTDAELVEFRYSGQPASVLRGFRALYFGIVYNCIVIGWVNLAMTKILGETLGLEKMTSVFICFLITVVYTSLSGVIGVMVTDFLQFSIAMFGAIYLAVASVRGIGGIGAIIGKLGEVYGAEKASAMTSFIPPFESGAVGLVTMPLAFFLVYIGLQWWSTGNTDGGSYFAQRMLSAKDERHSMLGFLWFNVAHYCLRPWPWIVVGLVAAVMFPYVKGADGVMPDPELGYIKVMLHFLPVGVLGLMMASFLAAYMSTIDTHLNWGASYLVNDFYKRFLVRDATQRHYILISVVATIIIALCGAVFTYLNKSIVGAWMLLSQINAGIGAFYLLRWYWWRVNAWTEITSIVTTLCVTAILKFGFPQIKFPITLVYTVPVSIIVAVIVTYLTAPVSSEKLVQFYRKVRPGGPGWRYVVTKYMPGEKLDPIPASRVLCFVAGVCAVYSALYGIGKIVLGAPGIGVIFLAVAVLCGAYIWSVLSGEK